MIRIIACGTVKDAWLRDGIQEYLKRLRAYDKLEIVEVPDEKAPASNSEAQNAKVIRTEGEKLLKRISADEYVILLDLAGKAMDSESFAHTLDRLYAEGHTKLAFVIGGSLGVSDDLIRRADMRWQLSRATFPHQLCRLIVLEQIYRAYKILRNEPYHK